jgi:hypothetical protein
MGTGVDWSNKARIFGFCANPGGNKRVLCRDCGRRTRIRESRPTLLSTGGRAPQKLLTCRHKIITISVYVLSLTDFSFLVENP